MGSVKKKKKGNMGERCGPNQLVKLSKGGASSFHKAKPKMRKYKCSVCGYWHLVP